ncbi:MAG: flagellar basal body-associated FliL family protein [Deltaproteobacteria bacterium]
MKKAKLDIWEDIPSIETQIPGAQISLRRDDEDGFANGGRWAFNKLLFLGAPLALIILLISGFLVYYLISNVFPDPQPPAAVSVSGPEAARLSSQAPSTGTPDTGSPSSLPSPEKTTILYLKDFMIDLKDASGSSHVLMCDIAFDIAGEQKQDPLQNTTALRNIILKTAQTRSVVALRSVEERKKLKKELAAALDKVLGDGSVKTVYFTNYFIM